MVQQTSEADGEYGSNEQTATIFHLDFSADEEVRWLRHEINFEDRVPTQEEFEEHYERVGEQTLPLGDEVMNALGRVWAGWNEGSGHETRAFAEAEARSLSVGDVIVLDGTAYLAQAFGGYEALDLDVEAAAEN